MPIIFFAIYVIYVIVFKFSGEDKKDLITILTDDSLKYSLLGGYVFYKVFHKLEQVVDRRFNIVKKQGSLELFSQSIFKNIITNIVNNLNFKMILVIIIIIIHLYCMFYFKSIKDFVKFENIFKELIGFLVGYITGSSKSKTNEDDNKK